MRPMVLDWRPRHDPRSRDFPVRTVTSRSTVRRRRTWKAGPVLDQGAEGACVGYGWAAELLAGPTKPARPVTADEGRSLALSLYSRAQVLDDVPGEAYAGTSVLAGAQAAVERGFIESYRWAFTIDEVRDALIEVGPVVIGIPWHASMYETGAGGDVIVKGEQVGGHCLLLTGYTPARQRDGAEVFRWRNSWGEGYGVDGDGFIGADLLAGLLAQDGEACVATGRRRVDF